MNASAAGCEIHATKSFFRLTPFDIGLPDSLDQHGSVIECEAIIEKCPFPDRTVLFGMFEH
jgi:hypothetical protein